MMGQSLESQLQKTTRKDDEKVKHKTGYNVWLYGEKFWHRTYKGARDRVNKAFYCSEPQIIDCKTGEQVFHDPKEN